MTKTPVAEEGLQKFKQKTNNHENKTKTSKYTYIQFCIKHTVEEKKTNQLWVTHQNLMDQNKGKKRQGMQK